MSGVMVIWITPYVAFELHDLLSGEDSEFDKANTAITHVKHEDGASIFVIKFLLLVNIIKLLPKHCLIV